MIVYVESNFVLEVALQQEQYHACEQLVALAEASRIKIAIPAFSLAEPFHTLGRRDANRRTLARNLDAELGQLRRSDSLTNEVDTLRSMTGFLVHSGRIEATGLKNAIDRLVNCSHIIPSSVEVFRKAWELETKHGLTSPDAIVLSSILIDLDERQPDASIHLNRNSKDFEDPELIALLEDRRCSFLPSFENGLQFVSSKLA